MIKQIWKKKLKVWETSIIFLKPNFKTSYKTRVSFLCFFFCVCHCMLFISPIKNAESWNLVSLLPYRGKKLAFWLLKIYYFILRFHCFIVVFLFIVCFLYVHKTNADFFVPDLIITEQLHHLFEAFYQFQFLFVLAFSQHH